MSNSQQPYTQSEWSFPVYVPVSTTDNAAKNNASLSVTTNEVAGQTEQRRHRSLASASPLPTTDVWGLPFAIATMEDAIELSDQVIQAGKPEYFITANLNYLMLTEENPELVPVNQRCFCFLADGNPIVWRSRLSPLRYRVEWPDRT
ncbi:MAG: hypothetical protein U0930_11945 [Pirellulales bacterium]